MGRALTRTSRGLTTLIWAALLTLALPARADAPPTAALYPLATADGSPASVADTAVKIGLMASHRYRLVEAPAPSDYNVACVRSYFCLRRLAGERQTDRLVAGLVEAEGAGLKVYLVLFDVGAQSTLKAVEARLPPQEVGARLPALVEQLVADEPRYPAAAFAPAQPRAAPPPSSAALDAEDAQVRAALRRREEAGRAQAERQQTPATLGDADEEELDEATPSLPPPPVFMAAVRVGGAWLAGYPLVASGVDLDLRLRGRWVVGLAAEQLNGYDRSFQTAFFLLSAAASGDRLLMSGAVHPLVGAEARAVMLAPQLSAAGLAARGGVHVDLTPGVALRGVLSVGAVYSRLLPQTVFELRALQPTASLQAQAVFKLR